MVLNNTWGSKSNARSRT